jgi:hypothetical protein
VILNHLTRAVLLVALFLVVHRGLHRKSWALVAKLVAVIVCGSLMAGWPSSFYTREFYAMARDLYAALSLLLAVELGYYVFRAFPRALALARWGALVVLLGTAAVVAGASPWLGWSSWSLSRAGLNTGTVWLFGGMALLVLWYNLPLDRWHATIIGGYTAYLLLSTVLLAKESLWRQYAAALDPVLASWWAYSAWSFGRVKVTVSEPLAVRT